MIAKRVLALAFALCVAAPALAVDAGKAIGTFTIDGTTSPLAFAVETRKENLFDDKKQDTIIVLTDKPLGTTKPDDEIDLSLRARRGELVALALRLDGTKLINVTAFYKGLSGLVILPGFWFQHTPAKTSATLKLAQHD